MNIFNHQIRSFNQPIFVPPIAQDDKYGTCRFFDFLNPQNLGRYIIQGYVTERTDGSGAKLLSVYSSNGAGGFDEVNPLVLKNCPILMTEDITRFGQFQFIVTATRTIGFHENPNSTYNEVTVEANFKPTFNPAEPQNFTPAIYQQTIFKSIPNSPRQSDYYGSSDVSGGWDIVSPHGYSPICMPGIVRTNAGVNSIDVYLSQGSNWKLPVQASSYNIYVNDDLARYTSTATKTARNLVQSRGVIIFDIDKDNSTSYSGITYNFFVREFINGAQVNSVTGSTSMTMRSISGSSSVYANTTARTQILLDLSVVNPVITTRNY